MAKFVEALLMELASIAEFVEPGHEVHEKETVIGEMTDIQKRLFTMAARLVDELVEERVKALAAWKAKVDISTMTIKDLSLLAGEAVDGTRYAELDEKSDTLTALMYIDISEEFGAWDKSKGVRKGFKIVTIPDERKQEIIAGAVSHLGS